MPNHSSGTSCTLDPLLLGNDAMKIDTSKLRAFVRSNGIAWPGCYPMVACMADCDCLCVDCVRDNYRLVLDATMHTGTDKQWEFSETMIHWEGDPIYCAHCNKPVESAYGLPTDGE